MDGNKKIRGIVIVSAITLALFSCRVQIPAYVGLYVDNSISYSDSTTYTGEVPLNIVDTTTVIEAGPKSDLHPAKEMIMVSSDNVYQHEVKELLEGIADSVQLLRCQVFELQKQLAGIPDTSITGEKPQLFRQADSLHKEPDFKQLLQVKNDTIAMLRNQVNELKKYAELKADTVYVTRETAGSPVAENQQNDQLSRQPMRSKDEQIMPGKDTTILARQDEKDEPLTGITDTTLFVAYYLWGEIKPIEEEKVLQQIEELFRNKVVAKVMLSGYTDSSGGEIINKEITNRRLNHLSEMIVPWIAKEKIFFQNFGDVFASDIVKEDERRVEIRIYTK